MNLKILLPLLRNKIQKELNKKVDNYKLIVDFEKEKIIINEEKNNFDTDFGLIKNQVFKIEPLIKKQINYDILNYIIVEIDKENNYKIFAYYLINNKKKKTEINI